MFARSSRLHRRPQLFRDPQVVRKGGRDANELELCTWRTAATESWSSRQGDSLTLRLQGPAPWNLRYWPVPNYDCLQLVDATLAFQAHRQSIEHKRIAHTVGANAVATNDQRTAREAVTEDRRSGYCCPIGIERELDGYSAPLRFIPG